MSTRDGQTLGSHKARGFHHVTGPGCIFAEEEMTDKGTWFSKRLEG